MTYLSTPMLVVDQRSLPQLKSQLESGWVVACLCAAWCDVCTRYRQAFDQWAGEVQQAHLVWIDVEDQADLVGNIDIENFPTLLIQRGHRVDFLGTVMPDVAVAQRLLQNAQATTDEQFARRLQADSALQEAQREADLLKLIEQC